MKFTALVAAALLALSGALLSGCNRDADRSASGGGSSASGTSGQTPSGGAAGQRNEGSTNPGGAPKRPASPSGSTGSK